MSMISGLIDELNKSADEWNGSNMFELARMCRNAADTIWELRDDLQRANAENAKLREELADAPKCETCEAMLDCDECLRADGSHRERRRLSTENAKLRELARMMWLACKSNGIVGGIYAYPDKNSNADERIRFEPLLRELGVEVDDGSR